MDQELEELTKEAVAANISFNSIKQVYQSAKEGHHLLLLSTLKSFNSPEVCSLVLNIVSNKVNYRNRCDLVSNVHVLDPLRKISLRIGICSLIISWQRLAVIQERKIFCEMQTKEHSEQSHHYTPFSHFVSHLLYRSPFPIWLIPRNQVKYHSRFVATDDGRFEIYSTKYCKQGKPIDCSQNCLEESPKCADLAERSHNN